MTNCVMCGIIQESLVCSDCKERYSEQEIKDTMDDKPYESPWPELDANPYLISTRGN